MPEVEDLISVWKPLVESINDWQALTQGLVLKQTTCGPVYELPNPLQRSNESFAIADMRNLSFAEPHHHTNGEIEIYFILQGSGLAVVGGEEVRISKGSLIVIPPEISHFTVPESDLVIAVINTPPFDARNVVVDVKTNEEVGFYREQFDELTKEQS